MVCIDCRASVIGDVPSHLRSSGRCRKCYPSYLEKQQLQNSAKSVVEQEQKKVEEQEAKDEEIDSRFDILDF